MDTQSFQRLFANLDSLRRRPLISADSPADGGLLRKSSRHSFQNKRGRSGILGTRLMCENLQSVWA